MDICIIAGQGKLPKILANKSKDSLVICVKGLSNLRDFENPKEEILISELDKVIKLLVKYNIKLYNWPDDFKKYKSYPNIDGALVWDPPDEIWSYFPNCKIIQSLGAGVDHILKRKYPKNVNIIKLQDPNLASQMAEYAIMSVLMCQRKYFQYIDSLEYF